jgi:hypothetical protein
MNIVSVGDNIISPSLAVKKKGAEPLLNADSDRI